MVLTAVERRSATLVSADAAGYSRLMAADELATIEAIKVFRILPTDWSEETGEITPSLKVKRNVVLKRYADEIAAIYG